jgi:uncharacterized protein (DUF433 family)
MNNTIEHQIKVEDIILFLENEATDTDLKDIYNYSKINPMEFIETYLLEIELCNRDDFGKDEIIEIIEEKGFEDEIKEHYKDELNTFSPTSILDQIVIDKFAQLIDKFSPIELDKILSHYL